MIIFMLHFLVMLTELKAKNLVSTCTGYVNDWDNEIDWEVGSNRFVTGLYSVHDNHKEDRRWKFCIGSASGVTASDCSWSSNLNGFDKKVHFSCNRDYAITGFKSHHHNWHEDRMWRIKCCRVRGTHLIDQGWSGYANDWDRKLDYKCKSDEVVTGVYSYHNNKREDRRWKFRCAKFGAQPQYHIESSLSGYKNDWDKILAWDAGQNKMITGFHSYHNNHREDRRWQFYYGSTAPALGCQQRYWSGDINGWDSKLSFSCPDRSVLNGVMSSHHNYKEDRRWRFRCCELPNTVYVKRHGYSGYINNWDGPMDWICPQSNAAVVGLYSYHDNHREDRRWKIQCGEILKVH